jgi:hypothetical protein
MKFIRFYEQKRHQLCRIIVYQRINDKLEKEAKHTSTSHQYVLRKLDTIKKSTIAAVFGTLNNNLSPSSTVVTCLYPKNNQEGFNRMPRFLGNSIKNMLNNEE